MMLRKDIPCMDNCWTYGLSLMERLGIEVQQSSLDHVSFVLPCYCVLSAVECFSNLSRFNGLTCGIRFGGCDAFVLYKKLRSVSYNNLVRSKLMTGAYILSTKMDCGNLYCKAVRCCSLLKISLLKLIVGKVGLITPVTPSFHLASNKVGEVVHEPDVYTVMSNVTGLPSISVPIGLDENGMSFGLQVVGNGFDEVGLISFCKDVQKQVGLFVPFLFG